MNWALFADRLAVEFSGSVSRSNRIKEIGYRPAMS